jgi:hypothetical protein
LLETLSLAPDARIGAAPPLDPQPTEVDFPRGAARAGAFLSLRDAGFVAFQLNGKTLIES